MPADDPRLFAGWYENDQCVSKEEELTVQVGMVDRSLEARFFDDGLMVVNGGNVIVNDQNKVDGPACFFICFFLYSRQGCIFVLFMFLFIALQALNFLKTSLLLKLKWKLW